jgi:cell division protein FtsN
MPQDFAKRKPANAAKKAPARKIQAQRHSGEAPSRGRTLKVYLNGVLTGVFLSFLLYLGTLHKTAEPVQEVASAPPPAAAPEVPKPEFKFYTMLQQQSMEDGPDAVEHAADLPKPPSAATPPEPYFLQAGSFRQKSDAEQRRAELLLLGLNPKVEESNGDNGRWFRVSLGPFDSHESTSQARSLLAKQNIEAVLLRRSGP